VTACVLLLMLSACREDHAPPAKRVAPPTDPAAVAAQPEPGALERPERPAAPDRPGPAADQPTTPAPVARAACSGDAARACLRLDAPWRLVAVAGLCAAAGQGDDWAAIGALTVRDGTQEAAPRQGLVATWRRDEGVSAARVLHAHETVFWDARCADDGGLLTVGASRRRGVEEIVVAWWDSAGVETRELGRWRLPFGHTAASTQPAGAWGRPWGGFGDGTVWWRLLETRKDGPRLRSFVASLPGASRDLDDTLDVVTALPVGRFLVGTSAAARGGHTLLTVGAAEQVPRLALLDLQAGRRGGPAAITATRAVPFWPQQAGRSLGVAARTIGTRRKASAVAWLHGTAPSGPTVAQRLVDGRAVRRPVQAMLSDGRSLRAVGGAVAADGGLWLWGSLGRPPVVDGRAAGDATEPPREPALVRLRPSGVADAHAVLPNAALGWTAALEGGAASVMSTAAWSGGRAASANAPADDAPPVWAIGATGGTRVDVVCRAGARAQ
jgi:hypothetical protein